MATFISHLAIVNISTTPARTLFFSCTATHCSITDDDISTVYIKLFSIHQALRYLTSRTFITCLHGSTRHLHLYGTCFLCHTFQIKKAHCFKFIKRHRDTLTFTTRLYSFWSKAVAHWFHTHATLFTRSWHICTSRFHYFTYCIISDICQLPSSVDNSVFYDMMCISFLGRGAICTEILPALRRQKIEYFQ